MNRRDCIDFVNRNITDSNIKNFIFNGDEEDESSFLSSKNNIYHYFSNIMMLIFSYIYGRFRQWKEFDSVYDEDAKSRANNFIRVINVLERLYRENCLSFELVESLLLDIQIDIALKGHIEDEFQIQGDILQNHKFSFFTYKAKKARNTSRNNDPSTLEERLDELVEFIKLFPILREISFEFEKIDNVFSFSQNQEQIEERRLEKVYIVYKNEFHTRTFPSQINLHMSLLRRNKSVYYCLDRMDLKKSLSGDIDSLTLNYMMVGNLNGYLELNVSPQILEAPELYDSDNLYLTGDSILEELLVDIAFCGMYCNTAINNNIKDFYTINYKYIRNLALAVADIISDLGKTVLINEYKNKYPTLFDSAVEQKSYNWDIVIAMLLVEESASNVLKTIFFNSEDLFFKLIKNLEYRFGKESISAQDLENKAETYSQKSIEDFNKEYFGGEGENRKVNLNQHYKSILAEVRASVVVNGISKAMHSIGNSEKKITFPISIRSRIALIRQSYESSLSLKDKIYEIKLICDQTIRFLIIFYRGILAYANEKKEFEDESYYKSMGVEEIKRNQNDAENAFNDETRMWYKNLSDDKYNDTNILLDELKHFCELCSKPSESNSYNSLMKTMLGRTQILDTGELKVLYNCFSNISDDLELWDTVSRIIGFFEYLLTGNSRRSNKSEGAIFPYIALYEYTNHLRDGYNIAHFSLIMGNNAGKNIKVLSEFTYDLNEKYLCLPNALRSNNELDLWIEPLMVNYKQIIGEFLTE